MTPFRNIKGLVNYYSATFFTIILLITSVNASESAQLSAVESQRIEMTFGKSIIFKSDTPVNRVSIANPEVADFVLISSREIYVTGKAAGSTNITLWQDDHISAIYDIVVNYDISDLKHRLHEIFPGETDLQLTSTNKSITLSGKVTNAATLNHAISLAQAYAPEGSVKNLVQVGGVHQVMLEVRICEMSRALTKRLGINLFYTNGDNFAVSTLGGLAELVSPDNAELLTGPLGWAVSPAVNGFFRFDVGSSTWTGLIDALEEDSLIKVLAEPTLIALSGQSASFLAGGEFPVPVPQGLGTAAIEYKPFGVGLVFTPVVLNEDQINIKVSPEVSDLDFSTAVQFQGFIVPGLRTRRATTTIELGDGKSFAIAGLLRDNVRTVVNKFPLLGDIPVLGTLFNSKEFQREETELIIIVTPHLVKPLDMAKQTLPTDFYVEPNDTEFYLWGMVQGRAKASTSASGANIDGEFGHSMPED
jgi:pilus assembly protein CpaC